MAASCSGVKRTVSSLKDLISTFHEISTHNIPNHTIPLKRKFRDLSSGDIILPRFIKLEIGQNEDLLQFVQQALIHKDIPVAKVVQDEHNLLTFFLKRHLVIKEIITEVHSYGSQYGMSEDGKGHGVIINRISDSQRKSPVDYRTSLVTVHTTNLLKANGYDVHLLGGNSSPELFSTSKPRVKEAEESCNDGQEHPSSHCPYFMNKLKKLLGDQNSQPTHDLHSLYVERIIKEHKLLVGKNGVDKNLHQIEVMTRGDASDILNDAINLEDKLEYFKEGNITDFVCMHIVSHQKAFRQQQVMLLNLALSDKPCLQTQLIVGPVICKKNCCMEDFYSARFMQMKQASEMRYGQKCEGFEWESRLNLLTKAGLTVDFLGTASHSPLRIDLDLSTPADSRMGAFVLYNTARLASLLNYFSQEVEKGTYPPLPLIKDVDFTLLREQEDWELAYLYIASFPEIVTDSVEAVIGHGGQILAKVHTHRVVNFLMTFSKALSSYYSRYHILGGGEVHLLPLMYARLYLMQAAHQVMISALKLLDIPAVDQL